MGNDNIIYKIRINNCNVSGMSKKEANSKIFELTNNFKNKKIEFVFSGDESFTKTADLSDFNLNYNINDAISDAHSYGRINNIFVNNFKIAKALFYGKNIDMSLDYDENLVNDIIDDISTNLPNKLVQSGYYIEDNKLVVTKGKPGLVVDKDLFTQNLKTKLCDFYSDDLKMDIPVKTVEPDVIDFDKIHSEVYKEAKDAYFEKNPFKVFAESVGVDFDVDSAKKAFNSHSDDDEFTINLSITKPKTYLNDLDIDVFPDLLGTFSSNYSTSDKDRSTNLSLAASKLDGIIIAPGDVFSYNKIVGERSISAGYKEAKIYVGGKIVDGLGGGICQVSSTLYNAVVFANLEVTERYNHQFTTSYSFPGRDATVAYGSKDFKFVNNRTYPIKLSVVVDSGVAKVDIYGIKEDSDFDIDFDIETVSNIPYKTVYEIDSSIPKGSEQVKQFGLDGVIVNSYILKKKNGITVSRDLISTDKYNSLDKIVLKND